MENCKVIRYSDELKEPLFRYMRKVFLRYSVDYIDYGILHSSDRTPSLLVINHNDEVVGCHLYYCTRATLYGEQIDTQWGHDTFLDEEYRKEIGVDFLLARKKIPAFGVGLTETNAKMRKLMKSVFLEGVNNYYTITSSIFLSPLQKFLGIKATIKDVDYVKVNNILYRRVHSSNEIKIPNEGFWYKGYYDLDFIRDADFLDYRFFHCKVHDYKVFASDDSYFIVRESSYRGMPALMLSDFRYNPSVSKSADSLIRAVMKIARKSNLGIVYFVCGDKIIDKFFRNKIHYKTHLDFITSYKISPKTTFSLSGGDSDAEFLKA